MKQVFFKIPQKDGESKPESTATYVVYITDEEEYDKWKNGDTSVPFSAFTDSEIRVTHQGKQGDPVAAPEVDLGLLYHHVTDETLKKATGEAKEKLITFILNSDKSEQRKAKGGGDKITGTNPARGEANLGPGR